MRNSTMRFAKKLSITLALLALVVCMAVATFAVLPTSSSEVVSLALEEGSSTKLQTGLGLQYGANTLRTTTDDFYVGLFTRPNGDEYTPTADASSGIKMSGSGKVSTRVEVVAGSTLNYANLDANTSVFYGLIDNDIDTTFTFSVTLSMKNHTVTSAVNMVLTTYYSIDGTDFGKIEDTENVRQITVPVGTENYVSVQTVSMKVLGDSRSVRGAHVFAQLEVASGDQEITLSASNISVEAESHQFELDNASGIGLVISGPNRKTISIPNVLIPEGRSALANVYVKEGDTIALRTSLLDINVGAERMQEFSPTYTAGFGKFGGSCIDWYTYYNGEYSRNKSYLTRVDDELHLYKPDMADPLYTDKFNAYQGFKATFKVTSGVTNAQTINIIPRLIKSLNGASYEYWLPSTDRAEEDILNYQITIKVDNTAPTSPKLDDTKTLGQAIKNKVWYTPSDTFTLDYVNDGTLDNTSTSEEQVYAFIVDLAFADMPTDYDFTPGNFEPYTYTAGGKTYTATRQELGSYTANEGGKQPIRFGQPGKYGLVLYAIDGAGNVSAPTLYTPNQVGSPSAMVDWRTKTTGIYIKYGDDYELRPSPSNRLEFAKYASVFVLVGDQYHDENGECTFDINATQPASAQTSLVPAKRGQFVTVRIYMNSSQYNNYDLVRYALDTYVGADNPEYKVDRMDNRVYSVSFQMNDAIWDANNATERAVRAYFHRRITLSLVQDEPFVYTHNGNQALKIKLDNNIFFSFDDPNDSEEITTEPKIAIEYFKPMTITVRSEYRTNDAGQIILEGGGSVIIGGITYDIGEDFDQNAFVRGEIPFVVGGGEYYLRKELFVTDENDGGIKYKVYEMQGFNIASPNMEGFADAGEYYFRAYVTADDSTHYYGERIGSYVIEKADPGVIDAYAVAPLTYGQSLAELVFQSYDQSNNAISANEVLAFNGLTYQRVSTGVFGEFFIESPAIGSEQYLNHPVAVDYPISVVFRPVDLTYLTTDVIKNNWDILKTYMEEIYGIHGNVVGYQIKEGAQTSVNYNNVSMSIPITINHASATVIAIDETLAVNYDGYQKEASARAVVTQTGVALEDQPFIMEYKVLGADDSTYTKVAPEQAGQYVVRITIDSTRSNYESTPLIADMTIYKRELTISVDERSLGYTALDEEITAGGASSSDLLTYTYSHTQSASYISGYFKDEVFTQVSGLLYRYEFLKYANYDLMGEEVLIDELVWSEPVDVIGANLLEAGKYIMRVEVNNQNNGGEKYVAVDVKQVRRGDSANLSIVTPSATFNYDLVDLSGINRGKLGNLEYGQTLGEMRDAILGTSGSARYTPRGAVGTISVASRFIFETEDEYVDRINSETGVYNPLEFNANGDRIFPVLYNEQGAIVPYTVRMIWQAGTTVDGVFVPNTNFRSEEFTLPIYVVRAKADFSNYKLSDLTYGQKVGEAEFEGEVVSNGFVFGEGDFTLDIPAETLSAVLEGGENKVLCNFTPSEELMARYIPVSQVPINLFINKREVKINFELSTIAPEDYDGNTYTDAVTHVYGKPYAMPSVNIASVGINLDVRNLIPQYTYYRDYVEGEELAEGETVVEIDSVKYVKMTAITTSTKVGKYYVLAEISESDSNYYGSAFNTYFVIKGSLYFNGVIQKQTIEYGQNVSEVDFGAVSVMNDEFGNYNKLFNGIIKVAVMEGGELMYDYIPTVHLTSEKNVYLVFVPTGSASVVAEYENNFRPYVEQYTLKVLKKDLSENVVISGDRHVFNGNKKTLSALVLDPTTNEELPLIITYLTSGTKDGETQAGEHEVSIVMDDSVAFYTVNLTVTLVIDKAPLIVNGEDVTVVYDAKDHEFKPEYEEIVGFNGYEYNFEITYEDFTHNEMSGLPREVGRYYVKVKLVEANFSADLVVNYYVTPNYTGFNGLQQTYTGNEIVGVTPAFNDITLENGNVVAHPSVNYNVTYNNVFGEFDEKLPVDAGEYNVIVEFSHRGYFDIEIVTLVVEKAELKWTPNTVYNAKYTGEAISIDAIMLQGAPVFTLPVEIQTATYEYKTKGADVSEYTATAPVNAGEYDVRVTFVDNNYKGTRQTVMAIAKGDLVVRSMPRVDGNNGTILFNSMRDEVAFTYHVGEVYFESNAETEIYGSWKLVTDVSAYRVGERNITIEFVPENENYNSIQVEMLVYVSQRDVSDLITIDGAVLEDGKQKVYREFMAEGIKLEPTLTKALAYGDNAYFTITYDNSVLAPYSVKTMVVDGEVVYAPYIVGITLHDANYVGHIENVELYITTAVELDVVVPDLKEIELGEKINDNYIIENTGGVYIKSNGRAIEGSFTLTQDYQNRVMDKANKRPVELTFVPKNDGASVSAPIVTAYVNVKGASAGITANDVEISSFGSVVYGSPLSSFSIKLKDSFGVAGKVEWANPNEIIRVGAMAEYVFTPEDIDDYNVERMQIAVDVVKASMIATDESYVILYEGEKLGDVKPTLKLVNAYLAEQGTLTSEQEKVYEIANFEYTVTTDNPDYTATASDLGKYLEGRTVMVTVTHPDYERFTKEFQVFVKRKITDFAVSNTAKYYDDKAVTISDLGLALIGTAYVPSENDLYFKSITLNGTPVTEIKEVGEYVVTIAISEDIIGANGTELSGSHDGEYTFTYKVEKYDVSDYIDAYMLNDLGIRSEMEEGTTYAEYVDVTAQVVVKDEDGVVTKDFGIAKSYLKFNYFSKGKSYSYGTLPPTDAGEYEVEVSVLNNPYYVGTATFPYTILKRTATIEVPQAGYSFVYNPVNPVYIAPIISDGVSLDYLQIVYTPQGTNVGTTDVPANVGIYDVTMTIVNHPNMTGSVKTRLNILRASVTIVTIPSLTPIKYGMPLKASGITGGVAEAEGGDIIHGTFSFAEPERQDVSVGVREVELVFTPTNVNYGTSTCFAPITVNKATLSIEFDNLEKYYTGSALYPDITLDSGIRVTYAFRKGNLNVLNAVEAGQYEVTVTIVDPNYEGSSSALFNIFKAKAIEGESTLPALEPVVYGSALHSGAISGGNIVYVSGKSGVVGSFRYLNKDTVLGDVGFYDDVEVIFTPEDTLNFETFIFKMRVEVVKANASISVSANSFTYGEPLVSPTFTTFPLGLKTKNTEFDVNARGQILRTGTYLYTVEIDEKNFKGELTYSVIVNKKTIDVAFYRENVPVEGYNATFSNTYSAKIRIISDTLVAQDIINVQSIESHVIYRYQNNSTKEVFLAPPTAIGEYTVTATMEHDDYIINEKTASVYYNVTRATVSAIEFDLNSLSNQIYGSVTLPIVMTTPSNVSYTLSFDGYEGRMPTAVGEYSVTATITDPNYFATQRTAMFRIQPKPISLENVKAYSKSYDGLPSVEVSGELVGVMSGDDVDIKLFAHTRDNKVNVGVHNVVIEKWELYGLHAKNYELRDPIYNVYATITNKVITDPNTNSYITSPEGFSSNITVSFTEVYDTIDKTNLFTQMIGQKATVQVITVKENGLNTVLDSKVKFYVLIPEEYREAKNLTVKGLGNLESAIITREGDYVTFYADSSGEIIFYKNDFPYWMIIVFAVVGIIVLGTVFALIALPIRRRKRIPDDARKAHYYNETLEGREHAFRKKVEQEIIEKKRRWRY